MAARSVGSGTISFGLVSIPIKLYTATSPQSIGFNFIHPKCGGRVKMQYHCPIDNEVVERKDLIKGYEIAKDKFVTFTEDELKALDGERSDRLDIVEFVPEGSVDFIYIENTVFLGPGKGGDRAYALLSDAMTRTGRVAIGRYGARGKEQLVMLRPYKGGIVMHQVYYADEVRSMDDVEYSTNVPFKPVEQELADKLIEQLSTDKFSADKYRDEYRERVRAAVEQKAAGIEVTVPAEQPQAQIIDLFEALKRSLQEKGSLPTATDIANDSPEPAAVESNAAVTDIESAKPLKKASTPRKAPAPREKKAAGGEG
ncbi:MAG: Ku protein [Polyangiaceae bacterium]|nr:Ku protein [Polyangiaceae bacterium]